MEGVTQGHAQSSATSTSPEPSRTEPLEDASEQSMESLLRLRAKIDEEVTQRFTHELCLMLADVVGSTRFYQKHGDVKGRVLIQRHNDTLFPLIQHRGGKVVKTIGDGIMATFADPYAALTSAIAIQQHLWELNQEAAEEDVLQTKISLHHGHALVEANDIHGDLVNMSARINDMAKPDQILVSQLVYEHVNGGEKLVFLPLEPLYHKDGEKSIPVYEVLWLQNAEDEGKITVFRDFKGRDTSCFYCGLQEHAAGSCPSKQLKGHVGQLERLGYLRTQDILRLLQQEDLNTTLPPQTADKQIYEAFYEVSLAYQLRFLSKIWLTNSEVWREVERSSIPSTNSLVGTRLWLGVDCLRVGRYEQAKTFLDAAVTNNQNDYKPHIALGLWAMEQENPSAALQHWRRALTLTKTPLQEAYIRLLLHRLYAMNGTTELAGQELERALVKHRYLHEATYRQVTLMAKEGKEEKIPIRLQQLIKDDRSIYLKVLLDPAFTPLRTSFYPLLSKLFEEAQVQALDSVAHLIEQINALRAWYRQPQAELERIERILASMRRHIKSESYFGYCDAIDAGEHLQVRIRNLLGERQSALVKSFATTVRTVHQQLQTLSSPGANAARITKLQAKLAAVQQLPRKTANQFWHAWDALQKLQAEVEHLQPGRKHSTPTRRLSMLRSVLFAALGGSALVAALIVGVLVYLAYFSDMRLSGLQFFIFLLGGVLGGALLGSGLSWLWQRLKR